MTKRQVIISQLRDYFEAKGGVMTVDEYKAAEDAPIRLQALKRAIGPWSRVVAMIERKAEVAVAPVAPVEPQAAEPAAAEPALEAEQPAAEEPAAEKPKTAPKAKGA